MRVFIKRFWGFDPFEWPIISFSQKGSLDRLLKLSAPGDVMVGVGTMGPEVKEDQRGRLIGFAQFGRKRVASRAHLSPETYAKAPKGDDGEMKWPYSLVMTRVWRFTGEPLPGLVEVLGRQLPMAAISNAVLLDEKDAALVMGLASTEVTGWIVTQAQLDEHLAMEAAVGTGGTFGPAPTSHTSTTTKVIHQPAVTYVFRFAAADVWKVGWAYDSAKRLRQLNAHVPHEVLGGQRWTGNNGGLLEKWASADQAHAMEQRVLDAFDGDKKYGERVHCTREQMETAWLTARKG